MKYDCKKRAVASWENILNALIALLHDLLSKIVVKLSEGEISIKGSKIIVKM